MMASTRKGWRKLLVDQRRYFWRAIDTYFGVQVVVVTEAAFDHGMTGQRLTFTLDYDALRTPHGNGAVGFTQRAAVGPGVVALAIQHAVASTPSFTGDGGKKDVTLPPQILGELQEKASSPRVK